MIFQLMPTKAILKHGGCKSFLQSYLDLRPRQWPQLGYCGFAVNLMDTSKSGMSVLF